MKNIQIFYWNHGSLHVELVTAAEAMQILANPANKEVKMVNQTDRLQRLT